MSIVLGEPSPHLIFCIMKFDNLKKSIRYLLLPQSSILEHLEDTTSQLASDHIVVHPSTITGSIGVIMVTLNAQGLLEKIGVEPRATITSGT